jgi:predicted transcriptional regulator
MKMQGITVTIPPGYIDRLKDEGEKRDRSKSYIVREALAEHWDIQDE